MNTLDRILRDSELNAICGNSRTTRWRLIKEGKFPQPLQIGARSVGWRESDVRAWLASRPTGLIESVRERVA